MSEGLPVATGARPPKGWYFEDYAVGQETKSVWVAELLAIFPGLLWHGLGHRYAGDKEKAAGLVAVRARGNQELGQMSPEALIERLLSEKASKGAAS